MTHLSKRSRPAKTCASTRATGSASASAARTRIASAGTRSSRGRLACLCVPSVRNGHLTEEMLGFLESAGACLLNLNLFPTLAADERRAVGGALRAGAAEVGAVDQLQPRLRADRVAARRGAGPARSSAAGPTVLAVGMADLLPECLNWLYNVWVARPVMSASSATELSPQ